MVNFLYEYAKKVYHSGGESIAKKCYIHEDKEAVETCSKCGKAICKDCVVDYHGRLMCTTCVMPVANFFVGGSLHGDVGPPKIVIEKSEAKDK